MHMYASDMYYWLEHKSLFAQINPPLKWSLAAALWYYQWLGPSHSHVCKISPSLKPEAWSLIITVHYHIINNTSVEHTNICIYLELCWLWICKISPFLKPEAWSLKPEAWSLKPDVTSWCWLVKVLDSSVALWVRLSGAIGVQNFPIFWPSEWLKKKK